MGQEVSSFLHNNKNCHHQQSEQQQQQTHLRLLSKSRFNRIVQARIFGAPSSDSFPVRPPKSYLFLPSSSETTNNHDDDDEKIFKPQKVIQNIPILGVRMETSFLRDGTISGTAFWKSNYLSSVLVDHEEEAKRVKREQKRKLKREIDRSEREEMIRLGLIDASAVTEEEKDDEYYQTHYVAASQNNNSTSLQGTTRQQNQQYSPPQKEVQIPIRGKYFINENENLLVQIKLVFGFHLIIKNDDDSHNNNHNRQNEGFTTLSSELFWNRFDGKLHPLETSSSSSSFATESNPAEQDKFMENFRVEILPEIIPRRPKRLAFFTKKKANDENQFNDDEDPETAPEKSRRERLEDFEQVQKFLPELYRRERICEKTVDTTDSSAEEREDDENDDGDQNRQSRSQVPPLQSKTSFASNHQTTTTTQVNNDDNQNYHSSASKLTPSQTAMILALDALVNELGADVSSTILHQQSRAATVDTPTNNNINTKSGSLIRADSHHYQTMMNNTRNAASLTRQSSASHLGLMMMNLENNQLINNDPSKAASPIQFLKTLEAKKRRSYLLNNNNQEEDFNDEDESDDDENRQNGHQNNTNTGRSLITPNRKSKKNSNDDNKRVFSLRTKLRNQERQKRRMFHRLGGTWQIPSDEASLRKVFATFDVDNSSYIDREEFIDCYLDFESEMMGLSVAIEGGNILGDLSENNSTNNANDHNINNVGFGDEDANLVGSRSGCGKGRLSDMIQVTKSALRRDVDAYFEKFDKNRDQKLSFSEFQLFMLHRAKD